MSDQTTEEASLTTLQTVEEWKASLAELDVTQKATNLREAATALRLLVAEQHGHVSGCDHIRLRSIDGLVFRAIDVGREDDAKAAEPKSPEEAAKTFGQLFFYLLTGRECGDWMAERIQCGLSVQALILLDDCLVLGSSLEALDLCPASLYDEPRPRAVRPSAESRQSGRRCGRSPLKWVVLLQLLVGCALLNHAINMRHLRDESRSDAYHYRRQANVLSHQLSQESQERQRWEEQWGIERRGRLHAEERARTAEADAEQQRAMRAVLEGVRQHAEMAVRRLGEAGRGLAGLDLKKGARRLARELRDLLSFGDQHHHQPPQQQQCDCRRLVQEELSQLRSSKMVLQADYDACMNEVHRLGTLLNDE